MIRTLDELREYFKVLDETPPAGTTEDSEIMLGPILEALQDWSADDLGALCLHLLMLLAIRQGDEGIVVLKAVLLETAQILQQRQVIWGNPN